MASKPVVASDWLGGCAGCHMSFLDIDERLVTLLEKVTLHATPITDLKHPPEEGVTVGMLEGAVTNSTQEEVAKNMRKHCKCLIALGDCAVFGGVPALRNAADTRAAMQRAYVENESTPNGAVPADPDLARMTSVRALDQVVDVDIHVPGCPPSPDAIFHVLNELAEGRKPELKGTFLDWH
jgi:NAD-reducing hydrogenase small subunit